MHSLCLRVLSAVVVFLRSVARRIHFQSLGHFQDLFRWLSGPGTVPKGLPHVAAFEVVSPRCYRILGMNPGVTTLHGTNIYLVGTGKYRAIVDMGEKSAAPAVVSKLLDEVLPAVGCEQISCVLLTHGHYDHVGGVSELLLELAARGMQRPSVHKRRITENDDGSGIVEIGSFPAVDFECRHLHDGEEISIQGATLKTVYCPGHTDDSVVFVLKEDFALLSGDSVLGCGSSVFDDLHAYMQSLHRIRLHFLCQKSADTIDEGSQGWSKPPDSHLPPLHSVYPGHGPVVRERALAHVDAYISNRESREEQLLIALKKVGVASWISSLELVRVVYGDELPLPVWIPAQGNLLLHLKKLQQAQVVQCLPLLDLWRIKEGQVYNNP